MRDYEYMMAVDEKGQPYLAHAGWFGGGGNQKGSKKQDAKYYERASVNGRWRYFYSPQEWANFLKGGGKKVSQSAQNVLNSAKGAVNKAADKLGFDERQKLQNANFLNRSKRQEAYNNTALGKAENAVNNLTSGVKNKTEQMKNEFRKKKEAAGDKAGEAMSSLKDKAGSAASTVKNKAGELADKAGDAIGINQLKKLNDTEERLFSSDTNMFNRYARSKEFNNAVSDYARTPLGRVEGLGLLAGYEAKNAASSVKNKAGELADKANSAASSAASTVKNKVGELADRAADKLGVDERERLNDANFFNRNKRQEAYDNTALGKSENAIATAKNNVVDTVNDAKKKAQFAIDDLSDKASDAAITARKKAGELAKKADDIRNSIQDIANNASEKVTGASAKKEMDESGRAALMGLDDAVGNYMDKQASYNNSISGKANSAKNTTAESLKEAERSLKVMLNKAKDYLPDEQVKAIMDFVRKAK